LLDISDIVTNAEQDTRVQFGLLDAARLGYEYIIRRFNRASINIVSIALGIAFLSTLLMSDSLYRAYALAGGERLGVETYQYWLMFVAIIVSVVGITNAMLITVFERYREIGTMKCLGAMDRHILLLFLVESIIQGFTAILMVPIMEIITLLLGSIGLSMVLCGVATLYPAYRAARLHPVEALNYEL
jgi:predicted lysophospholipase L1 biosynthesis ABC-type transport system permease subunit